MRPQNVPRQRAFRGRRRCRDAAKQRRAQAARWLDMATEILPGKPSQLLLSVRDAACS
jgi:hypothetical protein